VVAKKKCVCSVLQLNSYSPSFLPLGTSGCVLLCTDTTNSSFTSNLQRRLSEGQKTYLAWCRGNGDYLKKLGIGEVTKYKLPGEGGIENVETLGDGWFRVERAIKNERGSLRDAITDFRVLAAGVDNVVVECRPHTGRWHQIRKHLSALSSPILGDVTHGNSKTNRMWRERGLPVHRIGLHLQRINLPTDEGSPPILAHAPVPPDLTELWREHCPEAVDIIIKHNK
jgi:23S rRNA-/tRNA-specific pseudouridylate synthase